MASIISAGTTSGTALNMSADTTGVLQLATGATPTTAVTIDTSQNVGIGTASPSYALDVQSSITTGAGTTIGSYNTASSGSSISTLRMRSAGTGASYWDINTGNTASGLNGSIRFFDNIAAAERMRIDSAGNVGIGTSSPANFLDISNTQNAETSIGLSNTSTGANAQVRTKYTTNSGLFTVGTTGTAHPYGGDAYVYQVANKGIRFATNDTQRMLIDNNGYLLVGYTTSNGAYKLQVNSQIFATSSTIATSDARYKTNVEPISNALTLVNKLNPVSFDWKKHPIHDFPEGKTIGFLAQEVKEVLKDTEYVNNIVKTNETTLEDDTKEEFLGIAEGNLISLLTKAIQEQQTIINDLKARIETLEGAKL